MPFLRRRGVMASENDMRRHTVIEPDSSASSGPSAFKTKQPAPRRSFANDLLNPSAANNARSRPSCDDHPDEEHTNDDGFGGASRRENGNNNGESSSVESNLPSLSTSMSIGRPSEDPYDRPESPPVQEQTPKHRRFSMLRFRNASDSQLSVRMRQQQLAEKPPPMPQREYLPTCLGPSFLPCLPDSAMAGNVC